MASSPYKAQSARNLFGSPLSPHRPLPQNPKRPLPQQPQHKAIQPHPKENGLIKTHSLPHSQAIPFIPPSKSSRSIGISATSPRQLMQRRRPQTPKNDPLPINNRPLSPISKSNSSGHRKVFFAPNQSNNNNHRNNNNFNGRKKKAASSKDIFFQSNFNYNKPRKISNSNQYPQSLSNHASPRRTHQHISFNNIPNKPFMNGSSCFTSPKNGHTNNNHNAHFNVYPQSQSYSNPPPQPTRSQSVSVHDHNKSDDDDDGDDDDNDSSDGEDGNNAQHRITKSFHIKKMNKKKNKNHKNKKKNKYHNKNDKHRHHHHHKSTKHKTRTYDDSNFTEADLNSDDEKDHQIDWIREEQVGAGAFGKVYKGYDKNTGKALAIKQIPFDPITLKNNDKNNDTVSLIDREANIMRQLRHKNIVEFLGYQRSIKYRTLCILMEFVSGDSIDHIYSKNGAFSESLIKKYSKQIMEGLEFAHKRKVIHRDIKGKNILVSHTGMVKLADFGSAKLADTTLGTNKFQPSMNYNYTPLWTAPEVLHGDYDDKIDIWSVGCVVIEMASAKQPWSECKFENPFAALYHIGQENNYPKYPNSLSKLCKDFIRLCLLRDPSKRCTASELLTHKFLDGQR